MPDAQRRKPQGDAFAPLGVPAYRFMWLTMAVTSLSTFLQFTVASWLMLEMTGSPLLRSTSHITHVSTKRHSIARAKDLDVRERSRRRQPVGIDISSRPASPLETQLLTVHEDLDRSDGSLPLR